MENIKKTSKSLKPNSANLTDSQCPTKQYKQEKKENSTGHATSKATLTKDSLQEITFLDEEQCKYVRYDGNHNFRAYCRNSEDDVFKDLIKNQNRKSNDKFLFMMKSKSSTEEDTSSNSFPPQSDINEKQESLQQGIEEEMSEMTETKIYEGFNNTSKIYSLPEQLLNKTLNKDSNNYENYNYIIPMDKEDVSQQVDYKNIIFPDDHSGESTGLEEFSDFEEIFCIGDYSNKVLIVTKDGIEVVKTKSSLENIRKVLFVLKKNAIKNIKDQEYHLDDLQHDIAKAIGIEPEKLKLLYIPKLEKNLKKDYTNVQLTKMLEPYVSAFKAISPENPIKYIQVEISDLIEHDDSIIVVIIENQTNGSQWLGGYRDTKTDIYYHNAETQTKPRSRYYGKSPWFKPPGLSTRDTQTHLPYKDIGINLPKDHSTQMWRTDHYIRKDTDVIVIPRSYVPFRSDITEHMRERATTIIQKCWKGYKVRKHDISGKLFSFLQLREERETMISNRLSQRRDSKQEVLNLLDMIFPYKNEDFYHLQWLLTKFKKHCDKTNNLSIISSAHKSSLYRCFEKEFDILTRIDRQKILSKFDSLQKKRKTFIEYSSSPYWKQNFDKDSMYLIETANTESCKEFKELYILFKRENMSVEQRIEVLMMFKRLLESYEHFEMKDELLELMDRECMMLSFGMNPDHLNYMRKWEEEILHHYFKNPQCHKPKRILTSEDMNLILRCKSCRKFKKITEYPFYLGQLEKNICKFCNSNYLAARIPKSYSPYCKILRQIRENEYSLGCPNPYVALLQPKCIEHIIQNIWGGRSIFTYISKPSLLRLPRWDNAEPWAPWNCILLTKDEADLHESIENVKEFYGHKYCQLIKYRHLMALKQFRPLIEIENNFRTIWQMFPDNVYSNNNKILQKSFAAAGDTFFI